MSSRPVPRSWIEEVRDLLASPPPRRLGPKEMRQASVLVPLYVEAGELWTVLTQRSEFLALHRSQIAFPGGAREVGEGAWEAAVRETEEEIGIVAGTILHLGELDEAETPSGFRIIPCVGAVPSPLVAEANPDEIAEVFSVPLRALADPRLIEDRRIVFNGEPRMLRIYHFGRRQIWGVTARIVQNLLERLGLGTLEAPPDGID